jgi:outer membrane receptor protein involved in Fe transport
VRFGLSAFAARTDGFRAHAAAEDAGADLWLGGGAAGSPWSLAVSGSSRDRDDPGALSASQLGRDRAGSDALFRFDREESRRGRAALAFRKEDGGWPIRAVLHGTLRESRLLRTVLLAEALGDRALRDVSTGSAGGSLEVDRALGRNHRLRAGLDLGRDWLDTSYFAVDETGAAGARTAEARARRGRVGVFASGDWRATPRLRLTAGLRFDAIADERRGTEGTIDNTAWSPRVGASVRLGSLRGAPVAVFAQASRAFKAATLDQLLDPRPFPDFQGGTFRVSNPRLTPQRASTFEVGLSQDRRGRRLEVVGYRTAVADEIDFDPATLRYRNIGRSLHYGVEASARFLDGGAVSPHAAWAWTHVEATGEGRSGRQLKNIPEHRLRAGLSARLPGGVRAELRLVWSGPRWLDDANAYPLRDERVVDVRLARSFGRVRLRLDALNLTDRRWEPFGYVVPDFSGGEAPYYSPAPGRAVRLGADLTL